MTKGLISIFAMPQEIDDLHITLYNLKRNVAMLPHDIVMDIDLTFCMSAELTDWSKTQLPQSYFIEKFNALRPLMDWSLNPKIRVEFADGILGCVSHRRNSLRHLDEYDYTVWLDTDVFFKDTTLLYMDAGFKAIRDTGNDYFVLTPQFVKQWDTSWDSIVHPAYLNYTLDYELEADIFNDTLIEHGEISVKPIDTFKFAGGWFTMFSNQLLKVIGVPESFGHYGMEDTFIVEASKMLMNINHKIKPTQYVLYNHLVGETYVHRCNQHMKEFVKSTGKKEEFRKIATQNFNKELQSFLQRMTV
jgi:hypothetical protein